MVNFCYSQPGNKNSNNLSNEIIHISQYDNSLLPINFKLVDHGSGLPEWEIQQVVQTDDGYVWLSIWNYGLVRYDGYHFRSFIPIPGDSTSVPAHISQISKSSKTKFGAFKKVG